MSADRSKLPIVESRDELVAYLASGGKPRDQWRIGTEHEKFGFCTETYKPLPYDGTKSVRGMLEQFVARFGWLPVYEDGNLISLKQPGEGITASITLEPGGQFELSGAPLETLHQTCEEVGAHLRQVSEIGDGLKVAFLGLGFSPKWSLEETPVMPKGRYVIMRDYMAKKGALGRDMMFRSCTVQVNLDFADEADMVRKLRVSLALQPIATAIFADSPFTEGRPNGFLSYRSELWRDTDPDRTGMLPVAFEDGMGFERYVDYALDVPLYFVYRDGVYHDVAGESFRDFLAGKLKGLPGVRPTLPDWEDHLTTLFPEVRLKRFLEMRGADGGPWRRLCALPALWVGLLYDSAALDAAWELVRDWSAEERQVLLDQVPATALATKFRGRKVNDIAADMLEIARSGLKNRDQRDRIGDTEEPFLNAIATIVEDGRTPAEDLLDLYHGEWNGDIDRIFAECAY